MIQIKPKTLHHQKIVLDTLKFAACKLGTLVHHGEAKDKKWWLELKRNRFQDIQAEMKSN